jgi:hypothetical protein
MLGQLKTRWNQLKAGADTTPNETKLRGDNMKKEAIIIKEKEGHSVTRNEFKELEEKYEKVGKGAAEHFKRARSCG